MRNPINKPEMVDISKSLEYIRKEKKLSRPQFARQCGLSIQAYRDILLKRIVPDMRMIKSISKKIELPIDIFLFMSLKENALPDEERKKVFVGIKPHLDELTKLIFLNNSSKRVLVQ